MGSSGDINTAFPREEEEEQEMEKGTRVTIPGRVSHALQYTPARTAQPRLLHFQSRFLSGTSLAAGAQRPRAAVAARPAGEDTDRVHHCKALSVLFCK